MDRRKFLGYTSAMFGLVALGVSIYLYEDSHSFVSHVLRELIGDFTMEPQQERRFVNAFAESFGPEKLAAMIGLYRIQSDAGLGMAFTRSRIDHFERALVTEFLTTTDYLRKRHELKPSVIYLGHKLCSNPFARFA